MDNLRKQADMPKGTCSFDPCDRPARAAGFCHGHYWQSRNKPELTPIINTWPERLWIKVNKTETCWLWTGAIQGAGYGNAQHPDGSIKLAHRLVYELEVGPIPEGLELDHLCRVRACVNPKHLEPVTSQENWRRGDATSAIHARKTHCIRGHEFTPENTKLARGGRVRRCRTCDRTVRDPRRRQKRAQAKAAL